MRLLDSLGVGLAQLAGRVWSRFHPATRVLQEAVRLQGEGRDTEAIARLERYLGLTPEAYADPGLAARLAPFREGFAGVLNAVVLTVLVASLSGERQEDALALLAADAGIRPSDLREPRLVQEKLARRLEGMHEGAALLYRVAVARLAEPAEGAEILERDLGIDPEGARDPGRLAKAVRERIKGLDWQLRSGWLAVLLQRLSEAGRKADLAALLQMLLDVSQAEGADERTHLAQLLTLRGSLPARAAAAWTQEIASILVETGRPSLAAALLEAHLGLRPWDDDENPLQSLAAAVEPWLHSPALEAWVFLPVTLVVALLAAGRARKGMAILSIMAGKPPGQEEGLRAAMADLRSRLDQTEAGRLASVLLFVFFRLEETGHAGIATELAEGFWSAELASHSPEELLLRKLPTSAMSMSHDSLFFIWMFMLDRSALDPAQPAREVAEAYLERAFPRGEPVPQFPVVSTAGLLYHIWLIHGSREDPERALEVCRGIVSSLRQELALREVDIEERKRFVRFATFLRGAILEVGHAGASRETDPERAESRWIDLLVWDAELTERLLLERFLVEELRVVDRAEQEPVAGWPFASVKEPTSAGHLPDAGGALSFAVLSAGVETGLQARDASSRRFQPELFEIAGAALRQGADESSLARAIGPRGLFVRVFPEDAGELLRWYSFRSDGERLAAGPRGTGGEFDAERLRWAALRHDIRATLAHFEAVAKGVKRGLARRELAPALAVIREAVRGYAGPDKRARDTLENILRTVLRSTAGQCPPVVVDLLERVRPMVIRTFSEPDRQARWRDLAVNRLSAIVEDLGEASRSGLRKRLDEITGDFLDEVEAVWSLDGLASVLTAETDMVFHVADALHAVPLAHLRVAGEPLYRRVRSVRTSFSLILDFLQLQNDRGEIQGQDGGLLCVSAFERDDPVWPCTPWLHHGQLHLAREHGLTCHSAAEEPPGTAGVIQAALQGGQRFRAVTLCGHGTRERPGVILADGLWQGGGSDLSRVDWLLMVSCSLGRVEQTGDEDADGFCIQLALHRAVSVLACRWPVGALEAVAFANEALRHYLELEERTGRDPAFVREGLRARAVNLARRALLDGEGGERGRISLETAAAFELYGLG